MSTDGTGSGSHAGPYDYTVQGMASSSGDMPHSVTLDLLSSFSTPYLSTEGTWIGSQARPSDHIVQGTASSSADRPPLETQDLSLSLSSPYLRTMSTEVTGIGRQAGPHDHNIVQGTASSSADRPPLVAQDLLLSLSPPYLLTMSTEETGIGRQAGPSDHNIIQGTASSFADVPQNVPEDPCSSSPHVCWRRALRLEPKHKIFLSHSGKQKLFATYLCEALEERGHEPFFDRRDSSLPKREKFAELIIKAAQQCELLVVIVSKDYFMSKWPMIELSAFVQARKQGSFTNAKKPKVFPLFYELSINEVRDEGNHQKWYKEWEQFEGDDRINLEDWKEAVEQLPSFNGIPFDQGDIEKYRESIVKSICFSIPPHPKWDVVHVQGMSNICEVVRKRIIELDMLNIFNAKMIGFHGVGGGGKTTMCKVLCNEFTRDFEGRVCHLEFHMKNTNFKKLLKKALKSLANLSVHDTGGFDEDQCLAKLRSVIGKKKVFMAIDNVWDDDMLDSIKKARILMGGPFHEGSVVVVTSRSLETLRRLRLNEKACFEVPELGKDDAKNLFEYHAFPVKKSLSKVESEYVLKCVERCNFEKGNGQRHYHPLALEALGVQFSDLSLENPSKWEAKLQRMMDFDHLYGGDEVFGILSIGFDELSEDDQNLFMDVAKYLFICSWCDTKWLCCVHKKNEGELQAQLDILKGRGFLQHVEWTSQEVVMHDLYIQFASKEMTGIFNKSDVFETQKWIQMNVCDPKMMMDRNWSKLTRLHIEHLNYDTPQDLEILRDWDLQYFSRVEVLTLECYGVDSLTLGSLNLEPMKCLRSIRMEGDMRWFHEVNGMERLKQLYHFSWTINEIIQEVDDVETLTTMGKFPSSLKILEVRDVYASICSSAVDGCTQLEEICLSCIPPSTIINLSKFSSLKELIIIGPIDLPEEFFQICGLHHLNSLKELSLWRCEVDGHSQVNLRDQTRLQALTINNCCFQIRCLPKHIRRLQLSQGSYLNEDFVNILKTSALEDLEDLALIFQRDLKDFKDVGRWPRLKKLRLLGCNVSKLPNLSESTMLKTLVLGHVPWRDFRGDYEFQFGEDEVTMLSRLPLLQPVYVGYEEEECNFIQLGEVVPRRCQRKYIVDFSRRVLIKQFVDSKRALERELGVAPYKLHAFKQNWENAIEVKYIDYTMLL